MSPESETDNHDDPGFTFCCQKWCRPISVHALSASAEWPRDLDRVTSLNSCHDVRKKHTVRLVQARPRSLPKRALHTSVAILRTTQLQAIATHSDLATRSFEPMASLCGDSPSTFMLFPRLCIRFLRGVLPTTPDVSLFFPKCLLCELDHQ